MTIEVTDTELQNAKDLLSDADWRSDAYSFCGDDLNECEYTLSRSLILHASN
jgi:hypothetical protein